MMLLRMFCFVISWFLSSVCLADILTLDKVLSSVDTHFPMIQAAQLEINKMHANLLSAKGNFDPLIKSNFIISPNGIYQNRFFNAEAIMPMENSGNRVFTGYRIGTGDFPVYEQQKWTYDQGEIRFGFEMPMLRDKRIDEIRGKLIGARTRLKISEEDMRMQKLEAKRSAAFSYWDWVAEGKKLLVQNQMLTLAEVRQKVIEDRFHRGDAPQIEVTENQRIIVQRKAMIEMQKQLYQKAALVLSLYYRDSSGKAIVPNYHLLPDISRLKPNPEKHISNPERNLQQIVDIHPSIKQLNEQKNLSLLDLSLAKNKLLPKLSNRFYIAQDFGPGNPPLNRTSINYELVFELPIYQREARGQINASTTSLEKIDTEQQLISDRIKIGVKNALYQLQTTSESLSYVTNEVKMAKQLEEAEVIKYNHGDSNLFLVNLRELSTIETHLRFINSLCDYYKAEAEYRYATASI